MPESVSRQLIDSGVGITNLVPVATARADELSRAELRAGAARLEQSVRRVRPRVVAMLGLTAYRQAFGRIATTAGRQAESIADAELWVLPNPSGLNAHETVATLAVAYRAAAEAAGLALFDNGAPATSGRATTSSSHQPAG